MDYKFEDLFYKLLERDYENNDNFGFLSHMSVLVIKSLVPLSNEIGSAINYERYIKELNLWMEYRSDWNRPLENVIRTDYEAYWDYEDKSILYRMIPLIIVNEDETIMEDELIKNILFTSAKISSLFENIIIAHFIFHYINGEDKIYILEKIKSRIIAFGQVDFLKNYEDYFRIPKEDLDPNYAINFEKEKIKLLNILNGNEEVGYKSIHEIYSFLIAKDLEVETDLAIIIERIEKSEAISIDIPNFYKGLYRYMIMLRKSRIDPEDLLIEEYIEPDIFTFEERERFFHSLLNDSLLVKKYREGDYKKALVQCKSGHYLFTRKID